MDNNRHTRQLVLAGIFAAVAVVGSMLGFPVAGSKCAPVQHMVNILSAVILGPGWSVGIAFVASIIRNLLGIGSLMAFPGSMIGALCCGLTYKFTKKLELTCIAEALGTGILGGLCAYPVATLFMGIGGIAVTAYIVPFLISTVAGSILAYILIKMLEKSGILGSLMSQY